MRDPFSISNKYCTLCSLNEGAKSVCVGGEGLPLSRDHARLPVMILGEAPGRDEDEQNRPFVGASGKLLRSALKAEKVPYEQCYITNTVKCYPHGTPTDKQAAICIKNYLVKEIQLQKPLYILTLGSTALSALSPGYKVGEVRGKVIESWIGKEKALVFPVWHPAYILRNKSKEDIWRNDLSKFRAILEADLKIAL